jgi:hypothetical protein
MTQKPLISYAPLNRILGFAAIALLVGIEVSSWDDQKQAPTPTAKATPPIRQVPAVPATAIEAARTLLSAEKLIRDVSYRPDQAVQWTIAMADDGTRRYGYAAYVCQLLGEAGARHDDVAVRIVDANRVADAQEDPRSASLGAIRCRDEGRLD